MVDKSEKFRWLVRLGYAARGIVYLLIGYLALSTTRGDRGPNGAFAYLRDVPLGTPVLYLAALGLLGYALYRFCSLFLDLENVGTDTSGIAHRVGYGASGIAHLVLAYAAFQFARGSGPGDDGAEQAAGTILSVAFGSLVLGAVGMGFIVAAAFQAKSAFTRSFMRKISSEAPRSIEYLGRLGLFARAVVFLIIGWSLVQSAWLDSSTQVKNLGEAINSLADNGPLYTFVAVGLMLFGAFSLLLSRYRIVPDLDGADLRPVLR